MKNKSFILWIALVLLSSCHRFLDEYPDSDVSTEVDTKEKIAQLLTAAYPDASYFRFLELRTDNVNDRGNQLTASRLNEAMYYWNDYEEEELDSPTRYWLSCYRGIAHANQALALLAHYPDKKDTRLQALYAEAFLLRAYLHFMIANIWAPPYPGKEEAESLPGIPYIETPEKNALADYPVKNLQETYHLIERDLRYGLAWVRDDYYQHPKYHFNKKAAYAFAVRFFAYTAQWDEVIAYSNFVLGNDAAKSVLPYIDYLDKNSNEMIEHYADVHNPSNLLIASVESRWQEFYKNDRYGLGTSKKEEIFQRTTGSVAQIEGYLKGVRSLNGSSAYWPKFTHFRSADGLLNETTGQFTQNVLLTTDEVYLHRMEAYAMLNQIDLAVNDFLNYTRVKQVDGKSTTDTPYSQSDLTQVKSAEKDKIQPFYRPLTLEQAGIFYYISEISRQQFIHEGMRWFDLRRFHISVDRNTPGTIKRARYILQPEDSRKTLNLPFGITFSPTNKTPHE